MKIKSPFINTLNSFDVDPTELQSKSDTSYLINTFENHDILSIIKNITSRSPYNNVILGGKWALKLHGLNVGSLEKSDIDLIVYNPSREQLELLDVLRIAMPYKNQHLKISKYARRSFSIYCKLTILDFLVDRSPQPENLLTFKFSKSLTLPIQSIDKIIDARKTYGRPKDFKNSQFIKNNNFNI